MKQYTVIASFYGGPPEEVATYDDLDEALIRKGEIIRGEMGKRVEVEIREDEIEEEI